MDEIKRLRAALALMAPDAANTTAGMIELLRVAESPEAFDNGLLRHARRQLSGEVRHGARGINDADALALVEEGHSPAQVARRIARLTGGNAETIAQRLRQKLRARK
jgi:hypothetical protein